MDLPGHQQPLAEVRIEVAGEGCKPLTPTYSLAPESIRTVIGAKRLKPGHGIDPNGFWQEDLVPNSLLNPPGTAYRITRETSDGSISVSCISVPVTGGPFTVSELLVDPPGAIGSAALTLLIEELGIVHDWTEDGWGPFTPSIMTDAAIVNGAPQIFTTTVINGAGVVTGTQPAPAVDHRVAYLHNDTWFEDSEITSLIYGPGAGVVWSGANAQQGHIHRVKETSPGVMTGIAIWSSVAFGLDYAFLHVKLVDWDGAVLGQAATTLDSGSDSSFINRRLSIINKQRTTAFGLFFNEHRVTRPDLYGMAAGDIVTIDSTDATFDEIDIAVNSINTNQGMVQVIEPITGSTSPLAVDFGTIIHSGGSSQKRVTPFWLSTRVRTVSPTTVTVELKRWRPEDPEPDWSDPRVRRGTLVADGGVETMPTGAGRCALWTAHFFAGSNAAFGTCRFRRL